MNFIDRTKLELSNIDQSDDELTIRLQESNIIDPMAEYNPQSKNDLYAIYTTVLSILESIANDPQQMRTIKEEDQSISDVSTNLQKRIDQLKHKLNMMNAEDSNVGDSSFFALFKD